LVICARDGDVLAGVVVSGAAIILIAHREFIVMPVRPPIHWPVGRRDKREQDRDYGRRRDPVSRALYGSRRWRRERLVFLRAHPLCSECECYGIIRAATVVDHVDPHHGDETVFWDSGRSPGWWLRQCRAQLVDVNHPPGEVKVWRLHQTRIRGQNGDGGVHG